MQQIKEYEALQGKTIAHVFDTYYKSIVIGFTDGDYVHFDPFDDGELDITTWNDFEATPDTMSDEGLIALGFFTTESLEEARRNLRAFHSKQQEKRERAQLAAFFEKYPEDVAKLLSQREQANELQTS